MRAVNLLPNQGADDRGRLPSPPVLVACGRVVLVTAVLALMFLSASSKVAHAKQQTRISALAAALGQRVDWDRLLREVSQVTPSNVFLVTLNAQAPSMVTATTAGTAAPGLGTTLPQGFTVDGCTYSQEAVAVFLARLDVVPDLADMTLAHSQLGTSQGANGQTCPSGMVSFQLQGSVKATGASS